MKTWAMLALLGCSKKDQPDIGHITLPYCNYVKLYLVLLYGKVNPNVLIGSFLCWILPYGPFPWKWAWAVYLLYLKTWSECHIIKFLLVINYGLRCVAYSSRTLGYWPSVVLHGRCWVRFSTALALGWDFTLRTVSMEMGMSRVSLAFENLARVA